MTVRRYARIYGLIGAAALTAGALVACGSNDDPNSNDPTAGATASAEGSAAADGTATLTLADGQTYVVNLAPGVTEAIDIFGNDGGEPVNVWGGAGSATSGGLAVTAAVGSPFAIELPQSESTGYAWKAAGDTAPGSIVELVEDFTLSEDQGPGSPGTRYFVYRATSVGTGTLEFSEFPPGSSEPSTTVNVSITVTS